MKVQNQELRRTELQESKNPPVVAYARDIPKDKITSLKDSRGRYPADLTKLLQDADRKPWPFDLVLIATAAVLGTSEEKREVEERLKRAEVEFKIVDEENIRNG